MLRQATKLTLFDDVIKQIQYLILEGKLKPGDKLPPERELAQELGVSRNTLREALKALTLVGVLEVRQGGGTFISSDINTKLISTSFKFISITETKEIIALLEARKALEVATAYAAAERAEPQNIAELKKLVQLMRDNLNDIEKCSQYDVDFHLAISKASKNPYLITLQQAIRQPLFRAMQKTILLKKTLESALQYHEELLQAISNKDPRHAEDAMRRHLEKVEEDVKNYARKLNFK